MRDLRSRLITSVVILFAIGFLGSFGIDNTAHMAGFGAGFVFGKVYADRQPMNSREKQRAHALGWLAGAVLVASFAFMILHFRNPLPGR